MIKETKDLLKMLEAAGFKLVSATYGGGQAESPEDVVNDRAELVDHLIACGHGVLKVSYEDNEDWIYLVGGNDPCELVANYSCRETIGSAIMDRVIGEHSLRWEGSGPIAEEVVALEMRVTDLLEVLTVMQDALVNLASVAEDSDLSDTYPEILQQAHEALYYTCNPEEDNAK